jgi:hypothetical protein
MSSAANDKRGKLEEEFHSRMHDAEASPSQDLWARIDHELTVQENGLYKKRAGFYRQLAAACITLLLLAGGLGTYFFSGGPASEPQMAAVAPAPATDNSATTLPDPAVEESLAGTIATAENALAQPGSAIAEPATRATAAPGTAPGAMAAATGPISHSKIKINTPAADAISEPQHDNTTSTSPETATSTITGAERSKPGAEVPAVIYKSLRHTIATMSGADAKTTAPALARPSLAATAAEQAPAADFKMLNEQVMARARQQEEEQKAIALAQNKEATAGKKVSKDKGEEDSRWSLGMAYAPGYFEQNIGIPNQMMMMSAADARQSLMPSGALAMSSVYMDEAREEYAENTDPGFSFGVEAKAGFKLAKKLKLLAGLGFTQNTSRSKSSYVIEQFRGNTFAGGYESKGPSTIFLPSISSGFASDSLHVAKTSEYNVNYRYRHLTIPVGLQYEGNINNDWFWYGGAGVAANILVQTTILASASDVRDVDYDTGENSPFRKLQWSGNVSAGVGKRLANNLSVTVGPEFRSYFDTLLANPENALAPQGKPYTMGLNLAVNYELSSRK